MNAISQGQIQYAMTHMNACAEPCFYAPAFHTFIARPYLAHLCYGARGVGSFKLRKRIPRKQNLSFRRPEARATEVEEADWVFVDVDIKGVDNPDDEYRLLKAQVEDDAVRVVRAALKDAPAEVSVVLCTDDFIRALNKKYRGKDTATDTLSFPQGDEVVLGDIVISVDRAKVQAAERNYRVIDEVRVLLVHSLLHLLGYDHEASQAGFVDMARAEEKLISQVGWKGCGLCSTVDMKTRTFH